MKLKITLDGGAGELDSATIETKDDDSDATSEAIKDAIDDWTLSPGDTITIREL